MKLSSLLLLINVFITTIITQNTTNTFDIEGEGKEIKLQDVYVNGDKYHFLDFGSNSVAYGSDIQPCPVYIMVTGFDKEGRPILLEGQKVVFDHLPGDLDYSDLKRVYYVKVDKDYSINQHTDINVIKGNFTDINSSSKLYVNYPIVNKGTTVEKNVVNKIEGYYKGKSVYYFDLGLNGGNSSVAYETKNKSPVYSLTPDMANYTAFWKVYNVEATNDLKSIDEFNKNGIKPNETYKIYNRPMFKLDQTNNSNNTNATLPTSNAYVFHNQLIILLFIPLFYLI